MLLSTASTFAWTIGGDGCPNGYVNDCANSRGDLFLPNKSLTWVPNSVFSFALEDNIGFDSSGNAGFDTVTMGFQGQGGPTVQHSTVFNIFDSKYWLGQFGLNPRPTNFTTFADPQPSFLQQLVSNNSIPGMSYGYTAGNQYRFNKVFGSLVLGGYDQNRFTHTDVTFPFYEDISRDLLVNIQGITSDSPATSTNLLPGGSIAAFVDSTIPYLYLPLGACQAFERAFGLNYSSDFDLYLVNSTQRQKLLDTNPNVTFTLSPNTTGGKTVDIVLPYGAFDLQINFPIIENPNTSYYFPLMRAANDTQYTLGRAFLQEAYLIADYDRSNFTIAPCAWDQNNVANAQLKPILSPNETSALANSKGAGGSGLSVGAIVGVVIGVVALIALLGLALWLVRRKKQQKKRLAELEAKEAGGVGKDSNDTNNEHKPFISAPIGGELGGGEIHEMNAPYKQAAQEMESPYKIDPNKHGYSEAPGHEYFGPGKHFAHEMQGSQRPIFEMPGSDVQEMPTPDNRTEVNK